MPRAAACVIDCLEFDADLRRLDPAEEIAFLALECEWLGALRLAYDLVALYPRATGDSVSPVLIHFYASRCAAVRAQIAAWHLRDQAFAGQSRKWRARGHSYLADALRHARGALMPPAAPARSREEERLPRSGSSVAAPGR